MARRAAARSAIVGLAVGVGLLALVSIVGGQRVSAAAEQVAEASAAHSDWDQFRGALTWQDSTLNEYYEAIRAGNPDVTERQNDLDQAIAAARAELTELDHQVGDSGLGQVGDVRDEYEAYTQAAQAAVGNPDTLSDDLIQDIRQRYMALRDDIVANSDWEQRQLDAYLADAREINQNTRLATLVVVVIDGLLCVVSSAVLLEHQRRAEREARANRYGATHDTLTGLANRHMLARRAREAVDRASPDRDLVGLLLLDLDRFKDVNDALGHWYGDRLLQRVANRLTEVSRKNDVVARLGGDEFAVLLPWVSSVEDIFTIADRVRREIQEPVVLDGLTIDFGASVGASVWPADARDSDELLQHADIAMYVAKRGNLGISIYSPGEDANDPASLSVLSELRRGIDRGELVLHYQPKVDAVTLRPVGVEALVRWQHPTRGLLPPGAFLPIIEATEFIDQLTDTVLNMAIAQIGEWRATQRVLPIAVNITARSLLSSSFPERVASMLRERAVPPHMLTLELTESALITAPAIVSEALRRLRQYGVLSSIDDFGTGYSSMAFLRDMPIHELKIDRSFVTTMRSDERNHAIVKAMVDLGNNLDLDVVAEGVEDQETLDTLARLGCGLIQGYFISKPLPITGLDNWLDGHLARPGPDSRTSEANARS